MRYGRVEYVYAEPIAQALVEDRAFRKWLLDRTEFSAFSEARLLHEEMKAHRSATAENWWRSHFTESCRCQGCSGKETDLLAIFESSTTVRFALHIEIKRPGDRFKANGVQSRGYPLRAQCWAQNAPPNVLPHNLASTVLIFSEADRALFLSHLPYFKTLITLEDIKRQFPHAAPR
jgi:hypothetical protein